MVTDASVHYTYAITYGMGSIKTKEDELNSSVDKVKQGQPEGMVEIFDELAPEIFRYAYSLTKCKDMAEDVVSETFLRAWKNIDTYKKGNFRAFLYTIARNYAFDTLRKDKHTTSLSDLNTPLTTEESVDSFAINKEQNEELLKEMMKLPDLQREIVTLRFFQQLSVKETAKVVGKSSINVRVIQHRALNELQKFIHE